MKFEMICKLHILNGILEQTCVGPNKNMETCNRKSEPSHAEIARFYFTHLQNPNSKPIYIRVFDTVPFGSNQPNTFIKETQAIE